MNPLLSQSVTLHEWAGFIPSEWQSDHSTFHWATGPNDRLCPSSPLFPGKLINPIVVSCLERTVFCDWIQHFKAADVPVLSPPPPVYDIIYTPTHREVRPALLSLPGQENYTDNTCWWSVSIEQLRNYWPLGLWTCGCGELIIRKSDNADSMVLPLLYIKIQLDYEMIYVYYCHQISPTEG